MGLTTPTKRGQQTMIKYAETYEITTPESAEAGDSEETGFISEAEEMTFREAVEMLACTEPSDTPTGPRTWYTTEGDTDYRTGAEERRSYHPKTERDGRYMAKAYKTANDKRRNR